jgi:hypothetical protein
MRILIPAQTPVDDASYFSVGGIVVTNDLSTTFITNPNLGFNITVKRASENVGLLSGASELTDLGERYVELNFDIEVDRYGGGLSYTSYYLQSIDQSTLIILAMNGAMTENPDNSMFVYCLKRISHPTYGLVAQSSADLKELSFRECI